MKLKAMISKKNFEVNGTLKLTGSIKSKFSTAPLRFLSENFYRFLITIFENLESVFDLTTQIAQQLRKNSDLKSPQKYFK